jgi:hypothetical protein
MQNYLDDRKWLFMEKGLMTVWNELYTLSQNTYDPTLSILAPLTGRYSNSVAGTPAKAPPTNSRFGVPGSNPRPN